MDTHNSDQAGAATELERPEHLVTVTVDGQAKEVEQGRYIVADFKRLVGVAEDRELDLVQDGKLRPLADTDTIMVHAHEVFVSHVRTGGSS